MSYNIQITKTEVPYFVELYQFITTEWALYLTPYRYKITKSDIEYTPTVMERTDFEIEKGEERTVTISFATRENVSLTFLTSNIPRIRVKIIRYFVEADVEKVLFVGEGDIVGVSNRVLTLKAVDILSLNKCKVPPFVYSAYCNNTLFDSRCLLNKNNFRLTTIVTVHSGGSTLASTQLQSYASDFFTYGYVEWGSNTRLITKHDNTAGVIHIHVPFDEDVNGQTVKIYAGCDKTAQTCKNKFNNLQNFLGFPYIPLKNPVIWGVL
ncbi:MAG: phage BR0599 family protein [Brevinematales bacterium]|nr:phage BR0599 family protein [Brevinematales bacterium]